MAIVLFIFHTTTLLDFDHKETGADDDFITRIVTNCHSCLEMLHSNDEIIIILITSGTFKLMGYLILRENKAHTALKMGLKEFAKSKTGYRHTLWVLLQTKKSPHAFNSNSAFVKPKRK